MVKVVFPDVDLSGAGKEPRFESTGFSDDEWRRFEQDGLIVRRGVFDASEVEILKSCCLTFEKVAAKALGRVEGGFRNTLEISSHFARLICDRRLLGPAYDLFGEMTVNRPRIAGGHLV